MEKTKEKERRRTPMTMHKWFIILSLLTIPLVNIYFLIYWAFVQKVSQTRRNFSRAVIIWGIMVALLMVLTIIIFQPYLPNWLNFFQSEKIVEFPDYLGD